ncbi:hypothetical protein HETIRDRAFT_449234 [Heterobasidion irregulare TC 32-1]|uniref:Uncharacterized protein n=1 Tax=Heterobasidion irregulare (strain TC 32-1) TaxID=747525 RepID=W4KCQ0_HETIT|nr:uncharacterized protein HETIRDRAFT_449234 [Heterobasidion irregulare TC 32-1]ETW83519.1 hypothetical protein HETIRDRAFT_449234 [Heterobasidion irregulare TC 32-1]
MTRALCPSHDSRRLPLMIRASTDSRPHTPADDTRPLSHAHDSVSAGPQELSARCAPTLVDDSAHPHDVRASPPPPYIIPPRQLPPSLVCRPPPRSLVREYLVCARLARARTTRLRVLYLAPASLLVWSLRRPSPASLDHESLMPARVALPQTTRARVCIPHLASCLIVRLIVRVWSLCRPLLEPDSSTPDPWCLLESRCLRLPLTTRGRCIARLAAAPSDDPRSSRLASAPPKSRPLPLTTRPAPDVRLPLTTHLAAASPDSRALPQTTRASTDSRPHTPTDDTLPLSLARLAPSIPRPRFRSTGGLCPPNVRPLPQTTRASTDSRPHISHAHGACLLASSSLPRLPVHPIVRALSFRQTPSRFRDSPVILHVSRDPSTVRLVLSPSSPIRDSLVTALFVPAQRMRARVHVQPPSSLLAGLLVRNWSMHRPPRSLVPEFHVPARLAPAQHVR